MDDNTIQTELKKFNVTDAALIELKRTYGSMIIAGIEDKEGYKFVNDARKLVKSKRVEVEGRRKELKADSLNFGRAVDAEAKRITNELRGVEYHLEQQKNIIDGEKKRIADEEKERVRIAKEEAHKRNLEEAQRKIDAFSKFDVRLTVCEALLMTDNAFNEKIKASEESYKKHAEEKERERLLQIEIKEREEEESKRLMLEREKLEKETKELDDQRKEIEKEKASLDDKKSGWFAETVAKPMLDTLCMQKFDSGVHTPKGTISEPIISEHVITENEQVKPVESSITGVGLGLGVIDDPFKPKSLLTVGLTGSIEELILLQSIIIDSRDQYKSQHDVNEESLMDGFANQIELALRQ